MEVYAGYLTYTDHEVGRLIDHLKDIHQFDNTLVFIMIGDNGASKEGTFNGEHRPRSQRKADARRREYRLQPQQD